MKKKRKLKFDEIQVIYLLNKKEVTYTDCVGNYLMAFGTGLLRGKASLN